ncbi:DUF4238 domain-containing protein [Salipiger thiooxidans]|uniref:DUF4238 domain-containing protein n=1 Tax=Salipiger thiooxidans TaxID=282683 RepID=UPI001CFB9E4B|nr:DUF4238 domain-containing protein [Salipiger thiooxidans]
MAVMKRQHFVPKHILRRFSFDAAQKTLRVFHIPSSRLIERASLKEQCYGDYFYGKDLKIESSLATIEARQAAVIDRLTSTHDIFSLNITDIPMLLALQVSRTQQACHEHNQRMEPLFRLALHGRVEEEVLRKVKIEALGIVNATVSAALTLTPMLYDLRQVLIINRTGTPFVISDHPATWTNWFCRFNYPHHSGFGFSRSGLQLMMPISPSLAVGMFDVGVYDVQDTNGQIELRHEKHVYAINTLQWLQADKVLYCPPGFSEADAKKLAQSAERTTKRSVFTRFEGIGATGYYKKTSKDEFQAPSDGVVREIVHIATTGIDRDIRLPGLKMKQKPFRKYHDDRSLSGPTRDPVWSEMVTDFADHVKAKRLNFGEFNNYAAEHPFANDTGRIIKAELKRWHRRATSSAQEAD